MPFIVYLGGEVLQSAIREAVNSFPFFIPFRLKTYPSATPLSEKRYPNQTILLLACTMNKLPKRKSLSHFYTVSNK